MTKTIDTSDESRYFYRFRGDIPAEFKDLDPDYMFVSRDRINIELLGGFYHLGFAICQTEDNPNIWEIIRYDEDHEEQSGTYALPLVPNL